MKTPIKPTPGQEIVVVELEGVFQQRKAMVREFVVTRVGREYFHAWPKTHQVSHLEHRFRLDNWRESRLDGFIGRDRAFPTALDYHQEIERGELWRKLKDAFGPYNPPEEHDLETLRKVAELLKAETTRKVLASLKGKG